MNKYIVNVPMHVTLDIAVLAKNEQQAVYKSGEFSKTTLCADCQNKFTLGDLDETRDIAVKEYKKL